MESSMRGSGGLACGMTCTSTTSCPSSTTPSPGGLARPPTRMNSGCRFWRRPLPGQVPYVAELGLGSYACFLCPTKLIGVVRLFFFFFFFLALSH